MSPESATDGSADDLDRARSAALQFVRRGRQLMGPYLYNPERLEAALTNVVGRGGADNPTYRFDLMMDELFIEVMGDAGIEGRLFSEESEWTPVGQRTDYKVICDPFDNSTISVRGFREAAVAITFAGPDDRFICCALGDLVTARTYYADATGAYVFEDENHNRPPRPSRTARTTELEAATIVWPGASRNQRRAFANSGLADLDTTIHNIDGAVFFGRLADGQIDAYLDPFVGQPHYEIPCLELVQRAGGVVTDSAGHPFDVARLIRRLEQDRNGRTTVVAAANPALHQQIMQLLGTADDR